MEFLKLVSKLRKLEKNKRFFDMDIEKLRLRLLNQYVLELPLLDYGDNSTYFILKGLGDYLKSRARLDQDISYLTEDLLQKLNSSRILFCFAAVEGVDKMQLIDLLAHYTFLAVNAECMRKVYWSVYFEGKVFNDLKFEISKLQRKINYLYPKLCATSVQVLKALLMASKVQLRSPLTFAPGKNKYIVEEFVDSLLDALRQILECHATYKVIVQDQMLKLHEGVKFLSIFLHVKQEKFYALSDKMKDRIGVMIIEAGIVIFSLSMCKMKDGLAKETDFTLFGLLKDLQFVMEEVAQTCPQTSSSLGFPKTNELGSIDFFLENLKELVTSQAGSIAFPKDQILGVQEDLTFLRSFLRKIVNQRNQNIKFQAFWEGVMEVAYKAELVIDSAGLGDRLECLDTIPGDIKHMVTEARKISDSIGNDNEAQGITSNYIHLESQLSTPARNEVLVGLDEEVKTIADILTTGSKNLDIVAIVGMAGLGKTTLANTIYHHRSILDHFHIRAWCTVSQVYSKHNLLVQILSSVGSQSHDRYLNSNEDDLALMLFQCLKRNRYLIILDDVWDIGAWNLLERSLPNDANGSRILFTSRIENLSLQFKSDSKPHHLCHRSDKECLELLERKIFGKEDCPRALIEVLMQVAKKCKGLPHTVVIFAGILSRMEPDCWNEFANSLSSNTSINTEPLELSYIHLPEYLKPCLLYFCAFREDEDIPVRKLSWLWISEGFVQKTEEKSLEDVAEGYLKDLIGRSLVMVTKQRTLAGAKTCRLHDLVHEFCVAKAKEESFLRILQVDNDLSTFPGSCPHRLHICFKEAEELKKSRLLFPKLLCLLFSGSGRWNTIDLCDGSLWFPKSKLLRVLDIGDMQLAGRFPGEILLLVHLRYLAVNLPNMVSIPSAIDNLSRLQIFLVEGGAHDVELPYTIWNVRTLRHLRITSSKMYGFSLSNCNVEDSPDLDHLDTFSSLSIDCSCEQLQKILKKLPSIRMIKCVYNGGYHGNRNEILKLDSLSRLESLKLQFFFNCKFVEFPINLKKLSLAYNHWPWSEISTIGKLPNLEVLKLGPKSFVGEKWEMQEGEFSNLRFLKLSQLDLCSWTAYNSGNFSRLEQLVLLGCWDLEGVPLCLGESSSIEKIEVMLCPRESLAHSVMQIQQEQMDMGNQDLKIVIR